MNKLLPNDFYVHDSIKQEEQSDDGKHENEDYHSYSNNLGLLHPTERNDTAGDTNALSGFKKDCDICLEKCFYDEQLAYHRFWHTLDTKYTCLICHNTFSGKRLLYVHILSLHLKISYKSAIQPKKPTNSIQKPHQCDICLKRFAQYKNLVLHSRLHTGERTYNCPECYKTFICKYHLEKHMSIHIEFHECEVCHKQFNMKSKLTVHQGVHTEGKQFECNLCSKRFKQKRYMVQHMQTHNEKHEYKCNLCNVGFKRNNALIRHHMSVHVGSTQNSDANHFECEVCHKRFASIGYLAHHKRHKKFGCTKCHQHFSNQNRLTAHMTTHTGNKLNECNICHKRFAEKRGLRVHVMSHTGERPFECSICRKRFTTKSTLKSHIRTHTKVRLFKCYICHEQFADEKEMTLHIGTHFEKMKRT